MIPLVFLRENPDFVIERLGIKNFQASEYVNVILTMTKVVVAYKNSLMIILPNRIKLQKNRDFIQGREKRGSSVIKR
jgi:hypothetical protein